MIILNQYDFLTLRIYIAVTNVNFIKNEVRKGSNRIKNNN